MIVVTGATGFLGSYIARWLVMQGEQVRATYRSNARFDLVEDVQDKIEWVEADILDAPAIHDAIQGASEVYHAAATVSFSRHQAGRMQQVNVLGTANVVNAALEAGVEYLLHVSSVAAIGRKSQHALVRETDEWEDSPYNSQYAISKFRAEREVWRGMVEGLQVGIINPSIILGGGWWDQGSARIFSRVAGGQRFYPPGATAFTDVRDVAVIAHQLTKHRISGQRFIVAAENRSYQWMLQTIAGGLDMAAPSLAAKPWMIQTIRLADQLVSAATGKEPMITRELARNMLGSYEFDNQKLLHALDFSYRPLSNTIRETAACYQKTHGQGYGWLSF